MNGTSDTFDDKGDAVVFCYHASKSKFRVNCSSNSFNNYITWSSHNSQKHQKMIIVVASIRLCFTVQLPKNVAYCLVYLPGRKINIEKNSATEHFRHHAIYSLKTDVEMCGGLYRRPSLIEVEMEKGQRRLGWHSLHWILEWTGEISHSHKIYTFYTEYSDTLSFVSKYPMWSISVILRNFTKSL